MSGVHISEQSKTLRYQEIGLPVKARRESVILVSARHQATSRRSQSAHTDMNDRGQRSEMLFR
jgi:hypothetical protein